MSNESSRPVVLLATPCFGGQLTQGYVESLVELMQFAGDAGIDMRLALLGHDAVIARCRNTLVSAVLDRPEITHLLFIDADIAFDPSIVARLVGFGADVAACLYPLKVRNRSRSAEGEESLEQATLEYVGAFCGPAEIEVRDGFATAIYAGTGFMLIRRSVLERMASAYPEFKYEAADIYPRPDYASGRHHALFDSMIEPDTGIYLSEDYAFCRRWRELGGKVWLDMESRLTHIGSHRFVGDPGPRFSEVVRASPDPEKQAS
jgi:hypothetical protein